MEWILIAGALCLSTHHDICVKQTMDPNKYPYSLEIPGHPVESYLDLDKAKAWGSKVAKELDEFAPPKHDFVWETPCCTLENNSGMPIVTPLPPIMGKNSFIYGMTKEEFGTFIEEHARKGAHDAIWNGSK